MKRLHAARGILLWGLVLTAGAGEPPLPAVATTTDLAALAREIGGEAVSVDSLAAGTQDLHTLSPTPSLMLKARKAELLLKVGLELELWLEPLLGGARNPRIMPGTPGHVCLTEGIPRLGVPARADRAEGDIHPEGNPHVWLDPLNLRDMARQTESALAKARPREADRFRDNRLRLERRLDEALFGKPLVDAAGGDALADDLRSLEWNAFLDRRAPDGRSYGSLLGGWLKRMEPLRRRAVVQYHATFDYFLARFGLESAGQIEPKPGIPPSARHVQELTRTMRERKAGLILSTVYYETDVPRRLTEATGGALAVLPTSVGGTEDATDPVALYDAIVKRLLAASDAERKGR